MMPLLLFSSVGVDEFLGFVVPSPLEGKVSVNDYIRPEDFLEQGGKLSDSYRAPLRFGSLELPVSGKIRPGVGGDGNGPFFRSAALGGGFLQLSTEGSQGMMLL